MKTHAVSPSFGGPKASITRRKYTENHFPLLPDWIQHDWMTQKPFHDFETVSQNKFILP